MHFYKKTTSTPEQAKEAKEAEGREWLRHPTRAKKGQKAISLESFEMVRSLGKGKYGQVFLARYFGAYVGSGAAGSWWP